MDKILRKYIPIVEFLGKALGSRGEIVLHDVLNLENSVVAIANGEVSNRQIGAPATDLVLRVLKNNKHEKRNYICNYTGTLSTGDTVKSSTYFIKNDEGEIIGMLCINIDMSNLVNIKNLVDGLLDLADHVTKDEGISETFTLTSSDLTLKSIDSVVKSSDISPERMSYEEKLQVIEKLNEEGIFLIKGAVSESARALKVSEASIYRYLGKIKKSL